MAWFDNLLPPSAFFPGGPAPMPGVVPITPQNTLPPKFQMRDEFMYGYGVRPPGVMPEIQSRPWPELEIQKADSAPNYTLPGMPGLPPTVGPSGPRPPVQPRSFMPASNPPPARTMLPGALPEGANPPGAMGMGDLSYPGAMNMPASLAPEPERKSFDWGPDNSMWSVLTQAGAGMMRPSYYGLGGQLSQGLEAAGQAASTGQIQQLQMRKLRSEVESKESLTKSSRELAASLPKDHPARPYFALGLVEKGLEQLTPDYNKLIVPGPDGKPKLNETLMNAKAYIEAAGKITWGVIGHDAGGKPIHGWVSPVGGVPGVTPGSPAGAVPAGTPPAAPPSYPGAPSAPPAAPARPTPAQAPGDAVPPPPPGVDPYKWAEEQAKLRIQKQANEASRKERAPIVLQDIDRALDAIKDQGMRTGLPGVLARQIPGTGADKLEKVLDGVRAQIGFDQLNQMRQSSPTGAALGSVTERELHFLQSVMGSLSISQGEEQLRFNLKRLKNAMLDVIHGKDQGPAREKLDAPARGATRLRYNPATGKIE